MADETEMGWKVVDEYIQSEVASDEEDQKRIYRAQARASRKAKAERGRRARRWFPYRTRTNQPALTRTLPVAQPQQQQPQQQQRRLGLCFSCGESGHWKFECPLIRAFSDFKAFLYISICGFSVRGCYHIKTPNFPLPCGRGPTSLPS